MCLQSARESARPAVFVSLFVTLMGLAAGCQYGVTTPTSATGSGSGTGSGGTSGSTSLTYTKDIQPVLASDCVQCHGPSRREAGVDLSTYANVMKTVTPGSASSRLILVTRSGGIMFGQFSGNSSTRAAKATLIRDWIVSSGAAQ
jgi:hypothetical protein